MKVFDIVKVMTNGEFATNVIANEQFDQSFRFNDYGRGAALAVVLFVAILPIIIYNVQPDPEGGRAVMTRHDSRGSGSAEAGAKKAVVPVPEKTLPVTIAGYVQAVSGFLLAIWGISWLLIGIGRDNCTPIVIGSIVAGVVGSAAFFTGVGVIMRAKWGAQLEPHRRHHPGERRARVRVPRRHRQQRRAAQLRDRRRAPGGGGAPVARPARSGGRP